MFSPGQKVVCIDGSPVKTQNTVMLRLREGAVYVVRSIHTETGIPGYGVRLAELLNPSVIWSDGTEVEWSYQSERFRPLVSAETDAQESAEA